jgi:hypothetical protein
LNIESQRFLPKHFIRISRSISKSYASSKPCLIFQYIETLSKPKDADYSLNFRSISSSGIVVVKKDDGIFHPFPGRLLISYILQTVTLIHRRCEYLQENRFGIRNPNAGVQSLPKHQVTHAMTVMKSDKLG